MKRLLPFIVFLVVLIGGLIAVTVLLNPERHRAEITAVLSKPLKRPVVIGPLSMGYFPPVLRLSQVAAMKENGNPALEIELVTAPLDVSSLFKLKFAPTSVLLSHWKLNLTRKPEGHWDLAEWFSGLSGSGSAQGGSVREVRWNDGEIHATDPSVGTGQELVLGSVEGAWDPKEDSLTTSGAFVGLGAPDRLTFTAKGLLTSAAWSGDLQLANGSDLCAVRIDHQATSWSLVGKSTKWPLVNTLNFVRFYGRANARVSGSLSPVTLDGWQFQATKNGPRLTFQHAASIAGGLMEAKGTLEIATAGSVLHLDGAAKDIPSEALWALTNENLALSGKVTALAKDFELATSTGMVRLVNGDGYWELKDGAYSVPAVSQQKLAKAKTMPYIQKKFPDLATKGLPVNKVSAHWRVKEGLLVIDDGAFASTDMKAGWAAKIDFARQGLDGYIRLQLHEKDPKLTRLIPDRYRSQPLFGRLQGTWQEWTLRSLTMTRIPGAVQAKLRKAIR